MTDREKLLLTYFQLSRESRWTFRILLVLISVLFGYVLGVLWYTSARELEKGGKTLYLLDDTSVPSRSPIPIRLHTPTPREI
jgi:hypothetical protein